MAVVATVLTFAAFILVAGVAFGVLVFVGAGVLTILLRIVNRWRDILWTFRYKNDPVTVCFYDDPITRNPDLLSGRVRCRIGNDLCFETEIRDLHVFGTLSIPIADYGKGWCWGWEGEEEADAFLAARALV